MKNQLEKKLKKINPRVKPNNVLIIPAIINLNCVFSFKVLKNSLSISIFTTIKIKPCKTTHFKNLLDKKLSNLNQRYILQAF